MAQGFDRADVTLAADTATRLSTLLAAEGYTGRILPGFLEIDSQDVADLLRGDSSDVETNGVPTSVFSWPSPTGEPSRVWLHSTTGGAIRVTYSPKTSLQ